MSAFVSWSTCREAHADAWTATKVQWLAGQGGILHFSHTASPSFITLENTVRGWGHSSLCFTGTLQVSAAGLLIQVQTGSLCMCHAAFACLTPHAGFPRTHTAVQTTLWHLGGFPRGVLRQLTWSDRPSLRMCPTSHSPWHLMCSVPKIPRTMMAANAQQGSKQSCAAFAVT